MRKHIFIDRDGVLNVDVTPYVSRLEQLQLFPWTVEALDKLDKSGYDIYIVSNQQGVALGITTEEELGKMTEHIQSLVRDKGFQIKNFYHCTALDSANHPWRKPSPGMLLSAKDDFGIDLSKAYLIGDKWSDIECAGRAGAHPLLVLSGVTPPNSWAEWQYKPEQVFRNLLDAANWVVENPL
jgi:D-glycero-D-manno-heptose 1,7-bisphosphate phosphatase